MAKNWLTDEQVEQEIEELLGNEYVKLAKAEIRLRYRRRQYLYGLRNMEKKGKELAEAGYTLENIAEMMKETDDAES